MKYGCGSMRERRKLTGEWMKEKGGEDSEEGGKWRSLRSERSQQNRQFKNCAKLAKLDKMNITKRS